MIDDHQGLIAATLAGDPAASRAFVRALRPIVQARVARVLLRFGGGERVRQEVDDLTQEVFVSLFAEGGKVIRDWRPDGGLSLENFVGLVAQRRAIKTMTSRRRSPWTESATEAETLDRAVGSAGDAADQLEQRQLLTLTLDQLRATLSPRGMHLFELLLVERREIPEVMAETGMSRDALYAWRSRLAKQAREIAASLSDPAGASATPGEGVG